MCALHHADRPGEGLSSKYRDIDEDVFRRLEPLVAQASDIILGGCGEPLLDQETIRRLARLRDWNPHAKIIAFTNGVRLRDRNLAATVLPLLTDIHWSVNGVSQYEAVQIGGSCSAIEVALRVVRDFRRISGGRPRLSIDFILLRRNVADIVPAAQLAQEYEASELIFKDCTVHTPDIASESIRHDASLWATVQAEIEKAKQYGIPVVSPEGPRLVSPPKPGHGTRVLCSDPWNHVQVTVNGDVLLCCFGSTHIGNLRDADFPALWEGREANLYRQGLRTGDYYKECATCRKVLRGDPSGYERFLKTVPKT